MSEPSTADQRLRDLLDEVQASPWAFDFFALLRRIDVLRPDQPRTGEALRPRQEVLRLGQAPELDFAPAAIDALQRIGDAPPRLLVRFFGLLGPQGPMPLHFTEFVREQLRHHDDATLAHFLDLFHHRMLSLFYRAWAQTQPVVQLDRPDNDRFAIWLGALAGALPGRSQGLPPHQLAFHAGWLAGRSAHPEMLAKVLKQVMGVEVRVEEHIGHWLQVADDDQSRLGHARNRAERSARPAAQLGRNANAGSRVWDRQYRFRLHLGPLTLQQYSALLPGTAAWQALTACVHRFVGHGHDWDLVLALAPQQRPRAGLRARPRLGLLAWCGRTEAARTSGARLRPGHAFLDRATKVQPA